LMLILILILILILVLLFFCAGVTAPSTSISCKLFEISCLADLLPAVVLVLHAYLNTVVAVNVFFCACCRSVVVFNL
jgi:hypothetical protein